VPSADATKPGSAADRFFFDLPAAPLSKISGFLLITVSVQTQARAGLQHVPTRGDRYE